MPTARTAETETAAAVMRFTRRQHAQRIREARRAAAVGHPKAGTRLEDLRSCLSIPPNPDRQASCLLHAARTAKALGELEACRHDPDLDGIAVLIERTCQRGQVLQSLADTAAA
ncbi:hypothetical protein [Deinococcus sp. AJ005]|uniref:hypothetical protein n=1 Tax=Deinococcus sp. AJ005 TaxID=2652443 RepID=UPI00125CA68B|nr:hypothetical protein [Deinococcus sp. AJ005]QFP78543.1 hypothetical protein DAAJ005_18395 [Deinococcus sp. AJ005]